MIPPGKKGTPFASAPPSSGTSTSPAGTGCRRLRAEPAGHATQVRRPLQDLGAGYLPQRHEDHPRPRLLARCHPRHGPRPRARQRARHRRGPRRAPRLRALRGVPTGSRVRPAGEPKPQHFQIGRRTMRFKDDERSILKINEHIRITGIPTAAHEYHVNGRTPLEWFIDHYGQVQRRTVVTENNSLKI